MWTTRRKIRGRESHYDGWIPEITVVAAEKEAR